ncbi:MAG: hypothetical protein NWE89_00710, partial [Candidatus Bathyarchaeota archaeon]|nr:hypothetical protein [Candidatus Bathyarchaeota archaeon]
MPHYLKEKHDIGLLRSDGTTAVGLMLATLDGKPAYRTLTERYLKNQYYAGAPDYGALDPQSEIAIILDDFRSGFGLEVYDSSDPKRYYSSIGMDMRHRGMAIAGWTPTAITLPPITAVSITNADFELDANWTGDGARTDNRALSGTYSWIHDGAADEDYQDLTWNTNHKGHTFKFLCWVYGTTAGNAKIGISDDGGSTATWSDTNTTAAGWQQLTVSKTIGSGATGLRLLLHSVAVTGGTNWFDDAEIWQPTAGQPRAFAEFNDNLYIGIGNELYKLNTTTGNTLTSVGIFPTDIVELTHFKHHLVVVLDYGAVIEDCEDAWTAGDANTVCSADTGDYLVGSASAKMVVGAGLAVNSLIATEAISATNISSADGIELWIKSSIAQTATE